MKEADRYFTFLFRLLPVAFRARHGPELIALLTQMKDDLGPSPSRGALLRLYLAVTWDLVRQSSLPRSEPIQGTRTTAAKRERRWGVDTWLGDLRIALRGLQRKPGFSAVVIATLALGIGANTLIFSVADGVLFSPLPYKAPDRLVAAYQTNAGWIDSPNPTLRAFANSFPLSYPVYEDWLELSPVFEEVGVYSDATLTLTGDDRPERLLGARATYGVFAALGVRPQLGRLFLPADDEIGAERVVILSDGLWVRRFGSDAGVLGQTVALDDASYTIIGVTPPKFYFPDHEGQFWASFQDESKQQGRGTQFLEAVALLSSGVTIDRAQREMESVTEWIAEANPGDHDFGVRLVSYKEEVVGDVRAPLLLFLGAVGLVLLIACANITNLLLVRATERQRELAVRAALGAGRGRLLLQFVSESIVLSVAGGSAGLLIVLIGLKPLTALFPPGIPRAHEIGVDYRVLLFAAALSLLTGLLTGLLPALRAARTQIADELRAGGRTLAGGRKRNRTEEILVISEIALAFVLLMSAGLVLKSFARLTSVERGFVSDNLLTLSLNLPESRYDAESARTFYDELHERLGALPGVEAVAGARQVPILGGSSSGTTQVEGSAGIEETNVNRSMVTPAYFRLMGIPISSGRTISEEDREGSVPVVVISESMARTYWPNEDPIGWRLRFGGTDSARPWLTIVGVVGDVRHQQPHIDPRPWVYVPIGQSASLDQTAVLRTSTEPSAVIAGARNAVWEIDPILPLGRVATLDELIGRSMASPRFRTTLLSLMAALAIVLAIVGVYGVIAHAVVIRAREMSIRMALGARPGDVMGQVVGRGVRLALVGLVLGLVASAVGLRVMNSLLFEVSSSDPAIASLTAAALATAVILASYLPARRASRMNLVTTLQQ